MDVGKAIEMLQCAEINCDNVKRLGIPFVDFVKKQIQEAITLLHGETATPDPAIAVSCAAILEVMPALKGALENTELRKQLAAQGMHVNMEVLDNLEKYCIEQRLK